MGHSRSKILAVHLGFKNLEDFTSKMDSRARIIVMGDETVQKGLKQVS